jgi:phage-related protein
MIGFLLKIARAVVGSVIQIITSQINLIQDAITAPLRSFVQQVLGGIWKGDGASRFVQEMTNDVIPQLVGIGNINLNFGGLIRKSLDIMDRADRQATSKANELFDVFHKIINL